MSSTSGSRTRFPPPQAGQRAGGSWLTIGTASTAMRSAVSGAPPASAGGDLDLAHPLPVAVAAVPGRDLVPPPDLPRDAPVADVLHPVVVGALPLLGDDARALLAHRGERRLRERLRAHEPLRRERGLDDGVAAVAVPERDGVLLAPHEQAALLEVGDDRLARREAVEPGVRPGRRRHPRRVVHDAGRGEVVPPPGLEVVRVVRRGDLERPRAERRVDRGVGDHRHAPAGRHREHEFLADEGRVARVLRVDGDGGVARDRLGAGRRDDDALAAVRRRVAHVEEVPRRGLALDLQVRERGVAARAPVDDPLVAVDQPLARAGR